MSEVAPSAEAAPVQSSTPADSGAAVEMTTAEAAEVAASPELVDLETMGSRLVEVTIDGEKVRMPLSEVVANTQRAKASHKRFLEASELKKQLAQKEADIREFVQMLRGENPEQLLSQVGVDLNGLVEREMQRINLMEAMTPEERFQHEMKSEREQLRLEREAWKQEQDQHEQKKQNARLEAEAARWQEKYTKDFTEALGGIGISSQSSAYPKLLEYMAQLASEGLDAGIEMSPSDLASMAKEEYMGMVQGLLGGMQGENLHSFLGENVSKAFRSYDIQRLKGRDVPADTQPRTPRRRKVAPKKTYNVDEMRELLRKRRMGG